MAEIHISDWLASEIVLYQHVIPFKHYAIIILMKIDFVKFWL
jgi:hypothetical protein